MGVIEARRRILLNTPHIETVTSSGIANFDTDLISSLRSCKFSFLPVQEGSGDPSPTNIRPISGWNGLTVYKAGKNLLIRQKCVSHRQRRSLSGKIRPEKITKLF